MGLTNVDMPQYIHLFWSDRNSCCLNIYEDGNSSSGLSLTASCIQVWYVTLPVHQMSPVCSPHYVCFHSPHSVLFERLLTPRFHSCLCATSPSVPDSWASSWTSSWCFRSSFSLSSRSLLLWCLQVLLLPEPLQVFVSGVSLPSTSLCMLSGPGFSGSEDCSVISCLGCVC